MADTGGGAGGGGGQGGGVGPGQETQPAPTGPPEGGTDYRGVAAIAGVVSAILGIQGGSERDAYRDKAWIRKHVSSFNEEDWRTREGHLRILQDAYDVWRNLKAADPNSSYSKRTARHAAQQTRRDALRRNAVPQDPSRRTPSQRTPGNVQQRTTTDRVLELVRILGREYVKYLQQQQQQRAARQARRAGRQPVSLGDLLGDVVSGGVSTVNALAPAITQILQARRGSGSGVPTRFSGADLGVGGGDLAGLLSSLGLAGPLDQGGILEGLESDVNRDTILWKRSGVLGTGSRARAVPTVVGRNPDTGAIGFWLYAGKPVLFSGDLATCRRVNRITRRAAGRVGLRFRARGSRRRR